jgi:N-methylhydantoinase A/oxoprolinase/acetone carboxylase beta subunit
MIKNESCIVGVDTGGTFTDAVVMERGARRVLAAVKRPTTHHDLSQGIGEALHAVTTSAGVPPERIDGVAISTTLATNAMVEGRGARVALILIGHEKNISLPVVATKYVQGGHNFSGEEYKPLALESLLESVADCRGKVDAYAVCAAMSFVNPAHELVAAKAIGLVDAKPVYCSHRASELPGVEERAATAVLNARLMPLMQAFLSEVDAAMRNASIPARLLLVRGDLQAMAPEEAMENPVFTFASGPAASARYGAAAAVAEGASEAVVVDVGGTTTDVAFVREGKPAHKKGGSFIGEWETHVSAVAMHTAGVGGDSWIDPSVDGKASLAVGPRRVRPLAVTEGAPDPALWLAENPSEKCLLLAPDALSKAPDDPLIAWLAEHGASTASATMRALRVGEIGLASRLEPLLRRNLVVEAGFTVTDALHALGLVDFGVAERSRAGALAAAKALGLSLEELCERALERCRQKIEDTILRQCLFSTVGHALSGMLESRRTLGLLELNFRLKTPIVGLGAAAAALLPEVARRLDAPLILPERYEVGAAAGAALTYADVTE